jgi:hypothetical protein
MTKRSAACDFTGHQSDAIALQTTRICVVRIHVSVCVFVVSFFVRFKTGYTDDLRQIVELQLMFCAEDDIDYRSTIQREDEGHTKQCFITQYKSISITTPKNICL